MRTLLIALLIACGHEPQPHDTSVAGHQQAAREHEEAGKSAHNFVCTGGVRPLGPCWTVTSPSAIASHREAAEKHRAAAAALVAAEQQACAGIAEDDRAMSPFEHSADLESVEPLVERTYSSKAGTAGRQVGALVTFRAVPGLTAEWLQREIDCHLARNAALGHVVPEMPDCPLVPKGVSARVRSAGAGFAVEVRSDDPDTAREVLARAQRLVARPVSQR